MTTWLLYIEYSVWLYNVMYLIDIIFQTVALDNVYVLNDELVKIAGFQLECEWKLIWNFKGASLVVFLF